MADGMWGYAAPSEVQDFKDKLMDKLGLSGSIDFMKKFSSMAPDLSICDVKSLLRMLHEDKELILGLSAFISQKGWTVEPKERKNDPWTRPVVWDDYIPSWAQPPGPWSVPGVRKIGGLPVLKNFCRGLVGNGLTASMALPGTPGKPNETPRKGGIGDALLFFTQAKMTCTEEVYEELLRLMENLNLDNPHIVANIEDKIDTLFEDHDELVRAFQFFLPKFFWDPDLFGPKGALSAKHYWARAGALCENRTGAGDSAIRDLVSEYISENENETEDRPRIPFYAGELDKERSADGSDELDGAGSAGGNDEMDEMGSADGSESNERSEVSTETRERDDPGVRAETWVSTGTEAEVGAHLGQLDETRSRSENEMWSTTATGNETNAMDGLQAIPEIGTETSNGTSVLRSSVTDSGAEALHEAGGRGTGLGRAATRSSSSIEVGVNLRRDRFKDGDSRNEIARFGGGARVESGVNLPDPNGKGKGKSMYRAWVKGNVQDGAKPRDRTDCKMSGKAGGLTDAWAETDSEVPMTRSKSKGMERAATFKTWSKKSDTKTMDNVGIKTKIKVNGATQAKARFGLKNQKRFVEGAGSVESVMARASSRAAEDSHFDCRIKEGVCQRADADGVTSPSKTLLKNKTRMTTYKDGDWAQTKVKTKAANFVETQCMARQRLKSLKRGNVVAVGDGVAIDISKGTGEGMETTWGCGAEVEKKESNRDKDEEEGAEVETAVDTEEEAGERTRQDTVRYQGLLDEDRPPLDQRDLI